MAMAALARSLSSWLCGAAGGLLLAAVLWQPWEYYSCCHGGFGFEPYSVGPAGHWLVGSAPAPSGRYAVRLDEAAHWPRVALAFALFLLAALAAARPRDLPGA
jgi:hypothetical protein